MIVDNATQITPSHSRRTVVPASATAMLDIVAKGLPQTPTDSLDLLCVWLYSKRQELSAKDWPAFVTQCRQHPLLQRLHADPLTHRAYAKVRGYPGDAPLLDFIYSSEDEDLAPQGLEQEARAIFGYTRMSPACRAVRTRRRAIATWVDHVGARVGKTLRVLSIAAGHLREAGLSRACLDSQFEEWVALDQDRESLRMIEGDYGHLGVTPRHGTVRSVLRGGAATTTSCMPPACSTICHIERPNGLSRPCSGCCVPAVSSLSRTLCLRFPMWGKWNA